MRQRSMVLRMTDYAIALHGARSYDALAGIATDAMQSLVACDWVALSLAPSINPAPVSPRTWTSTLGIDWERLAQHAQTLAHEDPLYTARLRLTLEGPAAYERFLPGRAFARSRVYDEAWRTTGARQVLTYLNPGGLGLRLVAGKAGAGSFATGERDAMQAIGRMLDAATAKLAAEAGGSLRIAGRPSTIEAAWWLVCAPDGLVKRWKPGTLAVYRECLGDDVPVDRLPPAWVRVLERRSQGGPPEPLHFASNGRSITVYISPIRGAPGAEPEFSAFFVVSPLPLDPIARLMGLGLTRREAEVLRWTAEGKTGPEVGIILGISALTAKKHMENVFHTLGVGTRTAAVAVAVRAMNPRQPGSSSESGS